MENTEKNHAEQNADGHAESILELYKAYKDLEDGDDSAIADGETFTDIEEIRQRAEEMALSVEVRSDWHMVGDTDGQKPSEYRLLLTTGGPALQIVGDLSEHGEPENAKMQHQDWGTPWITYDPKVSKDDDWEDALMWFVGCFYFGD